MSRPGAVAPDAPFANGWLLERLGGGVAVLAIGREVPDIDGAEILEVPAEGHVRSRYLGDADGAVYVIRPDQVVAARWISASTETVSAAISAIWEAS